MDGFVYMCRWTKSPFRTLTCGITYLHVCMSSGTRENGIRDLVCGYGGKGREGELAMCVCMHVIHRSI